MVASSRARPDGVRFHQGKRSPPHRAIYAAQTIDEIAKLDDCKRGGHYSE